ncbi:MAG: hypothetical protein ACRDL8_12780, partial [Solirubrobacteraceae bacterium]
AVHRSTWFGGPSEPSDQGVAAEYLRAAAHLYADRIVRFANAVDPAEETLGPEWAHAWNVSDWTLDLTPDQAEQLATAFHALCAPYRHETGVDPSGSRVVRVQFQILPNPRDTTSS